LQSDEIKRTYKRGLRPGFLPGRALVCPGKKAAYNAAMGRLRALYGAHIGRIFVIGAVLTGIFHANQKEAFCGGCFLVVLQNVF
jgi:hypothetical protein